VIPYAVKSTVVLAVAAAIALMLRRRSAAARHLVWTAAVAALLALPPAAWLMPALRLPSAPAGPMAMFRVLATGQGSSAAPAPSRPGVPRAPETAPLGPSTLGLGAVTLIYAAGAALGLLQILAALANLRRLRRKSRPFPDAAVARELAAALGIDHPVEILEAPRGSMPMTCGILRPAVLMPAGAAEWGPERVRVVLLHELAHVRRGDVATHLLGRIALSLNWWNPLAWFAWREFVKERERATDDLVLAAGERPSDYAQHLLEIARGFKPAPATAWAALAMARCSQLEGRLVAILDARVNRRPAGRRAALAAAAAAVALAAPFAAIQAQDPSLPPDVDATMRAAASQRNYEMLDRAAAAYEQRGQFDLARRLLESAVAIREQVAGAGSAADVAGLVNLGDIAAKQRKPEDAASFYRQALSYGDRREAAPAFFFFGERAYAAGDDAIAENLFDRLRRLDPNGPKTGPATMWLAMIRERQGRNTEAAALFQEAIGLESAQPYELSNTLNNYAGFLRRQGRQDEAAHLDQTAAQVRRNALARLGTHVTSTPGVYRVGNGVTGPRLLYKVEPDYSQEARDAKYQGTVLVYVEITPDGRATNMQVVRGLGMGLDEKAIEAISKWKFAPGTKDGVPVPVAATIEVNFRLL